MRKYLAGLRLKIPAHWEQRASFNPIKYKIRIEGLHHAVYTYTRTILAHLLVFIFRSSVTKDLICCMPRVCMWGGGLVGMWGEGCVCVCVSVLKF